MHLRNSSECGTIAVRRFAMATRYVLTEYMNEAISEAVYDKLEDGSFAGKIPACKGVIAFGANLRSCEDELRSTLEDWILVGLKIGHSLPVLGPHAIHAGVV